MLSSEHDVNTPKSFEREYPGCPIVSAAACVFQGDRVLLVKRTQQPSQGLWSVPGGAIELGETIHDAVRRELREECNIEIEVHRILNVVDLVVPDESQQIKFHYVVIYLLARYVSGEAHPASDASDLRWATLQELDTLGMNAVVRKNMQQAFKIAREVGLLRDRGQSVR